MHQQTLAITLIADPEDKVPQRIAEICAETDSLIQTMRLHEQQGLMMGYYCISGSWGAIAKLEKQLERIANQFGGIQILQHTPELEKDRPFLPYIAHVTTTANVKTLDQLYQFFHEQEIEVYDSIVQYYQPNNSSLSMQTIQLHIAVPQDTHLAELREAFIVFCDENQYDAIFEPERI